MKSSAKSSNISKNAQFIDRTYIDKAHFADYVRQTTSLTVCNIFINIAIISMRYAQNHNYTSVFLCLSVQN